MGSDRREASWTPGSHQSRPTGSHEESLSEQVQVEENILGRGNRTCKGPELGENVAYSRNGEWKEMEGDGSRVDKTAGAVSESRVPLFMSGVAGLCCGPVGGGAGPGLRCLALCPLRLAGWLCLVAYDTLFVVATVATVASHLGGPRRPGHLGPVLMSMAKSGGSG